MAAGEAAGGGAAVTLLDGEDRPGKKLLLTGKGRCNLSNTLPLEQFLEGFGANGVFLRNACHRFFSGQLREFLAGIGVETAIERGGRIYPAGGGRRGARRAARVGRAARRPGAHRAARDARDPRARRPVSRGRRRLRGARRPRGAGRRRRLLPADRLARRRLPDRGGARAPHRRAPPGARPGRLPRAVLQAPRGAEAAQRQARRAAARPPGPRIVRRGPRHAVRHLRPGGLPGERGASARWRPRPPCRC